MRRFLIFCVAGAVNSAASYALYWALLHLMPYFLAYTLAYVFGIGLSYVLSARVVFKRPLSAKSALTFPLVYVVQYGLGMLLLPVLVHLARVPPVYAGAITMLALAPVTFLLARRVFRNSPDAG